MNMDPAVYLESVLHRPAPGKTRKNKAYNKANNKAHVY